MSGFRDHQIKSMDDFGGSDDVQPTQDIFDGMAPQVRPADADPPYYVISHGSDPRDYTGEELADMARHTWHEYATEFNQAASIRNEASRREAEARRKREEALEQIITASYGTTSPAGQPHYGQVPQTQLSPLFEDWKTYRARYIAGDDSALDQMLYCVRAEDDDRYDKVAADDLAADRAANATP